MLNLEISLTSQNNIEQKFNTISLQVIFATMKISKNKVVSIHYHLTDADGNVIDSSIQRGEPLKYIHGNKNLIPGMENGVEGKEVGDKLNLEIPPKDGYGEMNENLIYSIPKEQFGDQAVAAGMQFSAQTQQGQMKLTVKEVKENEIVVDANHDLAGKTLFFEVEVMEVREASESEIAHGHVH